MNDSEFAAAFENATLEDEFRHRDHVRMGWIYLREHPLLEALAKFSAALRRYAAAKGKTGLYHETITLAFLLLIYERMQRTPLATWPEFELLNSDLFDGNPSVLAAYYPAEVLSSDDARARFLLPDRNASR